MQTFLFKWEVFPKIGLVEGLTDAFNRAPALVRHKEVHEVAKEEYHHQSSLSISPRNETKLLQNDGQQYGPKDHGDEDEYVPSPPLDVFKHVESRRCI